MTLSLKLSPIQLESWHTPSHQIRGKFVFDTNKGIAMTWVINAGNTRVETHLYKFHRVLVCPEIKLILFLSMYEVMFDGAGNITFEMCDRKNMVETLGRKLMNIPESYTVTDSHELFFAKREEFLNEHRQRVLSGHFEDQALAATLQQALSYDVACLIMSHIPPKSAPWLSADITKKCRREDFFVHKWEPTEETQELKNMVHMIDREDHTGSSFLRRATLAHVGVKIV